MSFSQEMSAIPVPDYQGEGEMNDGFDDDDVGYYGSSGTRTPSKEKMPTIADKVDHLYVGQHGKPRAHTIAVPDIIEEETSDWRSINIVNVLSLLIAVEFSFFITSVYPYLTAITGGHATTTFFGYVVAVFCLLQGVTSPLFGWWSNRWKTTRDPIAAGCALLVLGNIIFALAQHADTNAERQWMVLLGRAVMGAGSGTMGVVRSYLATASTRKDRIKAISINVACFSIGIAIGPGLTAAFTPLGYPGSAYISGIIYVNMYTMPAYVGMVCCLAIILLLYTVFDEKYAGIVPDTTKHERFFVLPKFDWVAIMVCLFVWLTQNVVSTNIETILTPYTMIMYGWTDKQALQYLSYMILISALIAGSGFIVIAYTRLGKIDIRQQMIFFLSCFLVFHIVTIPWGLYPTPLPLMIRQNESTIDANMSSTTMGYGMSSTTMGYGMWTSTEDGNSTESAIRLAGCDPRLYNWCRKYQTVPWPLFAAMYDVFISIGFLLGAPLAVLYSMVLGPRRQGVMQGVLVQVGSGARTVAPIVMTQLFTHFGPAVAWGAEISLISLALLSVILFYKRLVPLRMVHDMKRGQMLRHKRGAVYRF